MRPEISFFWDCGRADILRWRVSTVFVECLHYCNRKISTLFSLHIFRNVSQSHNCFCVSRFSVEIKEQDECRCVWRHSRSRSLEPEEILRLQEKFKSQAIWMDIDKDVEHKPLSHAADGGINWYTHVGNFT